MNTTAGDGPRYCVICHRLFEEYGNSAEPVKQGRCCNACNDQVVIPMRIRLMREEREREGGLGNGNGEAA